MERLEPLAGERQIGESNKAVQACNDWLRLGPGRSLVALREKYTALNPDIPPTRAMPTLKVWSMNYSWSDRASLYDKRLEDEKNARARAIMESGLALDYERVLELKALANFLKIQIYTFGAMVVAQTQPAETQPGQETGHPYPYVWLRDRKIIGKGDKAITVDTIRFNEAIINQFRAVLDDLAQETGGRVKKAEITGRDGGPIELSDNERDKSLSELAKALGSLVSSEDTNGESGVGTAE